MLIRCVRLECMGVVSGWCCKEVYRFPHISYPYSTGISSFCSSIPTSLYIFNIFSFLFMLFLYNIANVAQRTFEIVQKLRSRWHGDIIISTSMSTTSPETSTCKVPSDVLRKLQADFVYDNGVVEISLLHV